VVGVGSPPTARGSRGAARVLAKPRSQLAPGSGVPFTRRVARRCTPTRSPRWPTCVRCRGAAWLESAVRGLGGERCSNRRSRARRLAPDTATSDSLVAVARPWHIRQSRGLRVHLLFGGLIRQLQQRKLRRRQQVAVANPVAEPVDLDGVGRVVQKFASRRYHERRANDARLTCSRTGRAHRLSGESGRSPALPNGGHRPIAGLARGKALFEGVLEAQVGRLLLGHLGTERNQHGSGASSSRTQEEQQEAGEDNGPHHPTNNPRQRRSRWRTRW